MIPRPASTWLHGVGRSLRAESDDALTRAHQRAQLRGHRAHEVRPPELSSTGASPSPPSAADHCDADPALRQGRVGGASSRTRADHRSCATRHLVIGARAAPVHLVPDASRHRRAAPRLAWLARKSAPSRSALERNRPRTASVLRMMVPANRAAVTAALQALACLSDSFASGPPLRTSSASARSGSRSGRSPEIDALEHATWRSAFSRVGAKASPSASSFCSVRCVMSSSIAAMTRTASSARGIVRSPFSVVGRSSGSAGSRRRTAEPRPSTRAVDGVDERRPAASSRSRRLRKSQSPGARGLPWPGRPTTAIQPCPPGAVQCDRHRPIIAEERARGIEPPFQAWEARVLTIGQRPQRGGQDTGAATTLCSCASAPLGPSSSPPRCWSGCWPTASPRKQDDRSIDEATAKGERVDAPVRELPVLGAGGESSLADYKGKVVVLNFWASWCKPCTEELPLLEKTHKRSPARTRRSWAPTTRTSRTRR